MAADDAKTKPDDSSKAQLNAKKEALGKLLDLLVPEAKVGGDEKVAGPSPVVDDLYGAVSSSDITSFANSARGAVERYRSAMRWLVGAVAAIGLVLFGSTAFTSGDPFASWQGWFGLALASVGLVLILTAATLVFQPVAASLGELADEFKRVRRKLDNKWRWWQSVKLGLFPRLASSWRLLAILEGAEVDAHLGPDMKNVVDLIDSIGNNQRSRREAAKDLANHQRWVAVTASMRQVASTDLAPLLAARVGLDKAKSDYGAALDQPIAELIGQTKELRERADREFNVLADKRHALDSTDFELGMNLLYRDVVLSESGVAQLRGIFRLSRRCLLTGAVLTLLGALLYVVGVKNSGQSAKSAERFVRAGTVEVKPGTAAADAFPAGCVSRPLSVVYFGKSTPKLADEFEVSVSAPPGCAGRFTVAGGRGSGDVTIDFDPSVKVP